MKRRNLFVGVLAVALAGCGSFASEGEELAYLSSLSNPSPSQWKRRKELIEKAEAVRADAEWTAREAREQQEERERPARQAREAKESALREQEIRQAQSAAQARMEAELKRENLVFGGNGVAELVAKAAKVAAESPGIAARHYRDAAKLCDGAMRAQYEDQARKLWKQAYGDLPFEDE